MNVGSLPLSPGKCWSIILAAVILSAIQPCHSDAHTQSTAFLTMRVQQERCTGEWHLALRDLQDAVGLDSNDDGQITWDELRSHSDGVFAYAMSHLHVQGGTTAGALRSTGLLVEDHSDGCYAVLRFVVDGLGRPSKLVINYQALFDLDPKHRGLLRLEDEGVTRLAVFGPETRVQGFTLGSDQSKAVPALKFVNEGIWHIWRGYDHILFLIALLLPGVLRRQEGAWQPVAAVWPAVMNILKIVTAFTVAHSITLSLAVLGLVHLPGRLIESAIAASVAVAALNNLVPFFSERGWMVAFGFGLLHGFGFANALRDLGVHAGQLAMTLFGFNFGVEAGQLAIVLVFLPVALAMRRLLFYSCVVLQGGSVSIMAISTTWLAERVLNFKWLPF
jgi:hypothetical protein